MESSDMDVTPVMKMRFTTVDVADLSFVKNAFRKPRDDVIS